MRVVIVGGGFCGLRCAKHLASHAQVSLFTDSPFFTYTPSVPKLLHTPSFAARITRSWNRHYPFEVINERVRKVTRKEVMAADIKRSYDYLIVCTGASYPVPLKDQSNVFTVTKVHETARAAAEIKRAKSILVIGGGLIGVEVAAELANMPEKEIVVVHPYPRLLERSSIKASEYARRWLEKRGVRLVLEDKVVKKVKSVYVTGKGARLHADVVLWCAGIAADASYYAGAKDDRGYIKVNEFLQAELASNVFVGGDIVSIKEEKTAQNALRHSEVIVKNVLRMSKGQSLCSYQSKRNMMVISLGSFSGIVTAPLFTLTGFLPSIIKKAVELWER